MLVSASSFLVSINSVWWYILTHSYTASLMQEGSLIFSLKDQETKKLIKKKKQDSLNWFVSCSFKMTEKVVSRLRGQTFHLRCLILSPFEALVIFVILVVSKSKM